MTQIRKQGCIAPLSKLTPREQIAKETAAKIQAINDERDRQIKQVYEEFKLKQKLLNIESERNGDVIQTCAHLSDSETP